MSQVIGETPGPCGWSAYNPAFLYAGDRRQRAAGIRADRCSVRLADLSQSSGRYAWNGWPRRRADRVGRAFQPDPAVSEV